MSRTKSSSSSRCASCGSARRKATRAATKTTSSRRARSCCSSGRRASARRRSPSRSPGRWAGYTEREKLEIAKRYLLPRQLHENGLAPGQLTVTDEALSEIITSYTREAGVRQLEREIGKLGRKIARRIAGGEVERVTVEAKDVDDLIGRPKVHPERMAREDDIGVATGMYYTPVGGDIMFVEASVMRGKGELVLTGQLGDVMKE